MTAEAITHPTYGNLVDVTNDPNRYAKPPPGYNGVGLNDDLDRLIRTRSDPRLKRLLVASYMLCFERRPGVVFIGLIIGVPTHLNSSALLLNSRHIVGMCAVRKPVSFFIFLRA